MTKKHTSEKRLTLIWALLVGVTLLSWETGAGWLNSHLFQAVVVIILALIKIRFIIRHFMDVRDAPLPLKLVMDGWCVVIGCALIGMIAHPFR